MGLNEFLLVLMKTFWSKWVNIGPYKFMWVLMGSMGVFIGSYGSL